ncbi:MAG TPA: hypothetical protein VM915_16230 [Verrucomicrobiae bacterium]|nr:hypothetical protein [Verrucomicrobiae bacterium]
MDVRAIDIRSSGIDLSRLRDAASQTGGASLTSLS